MPHAIALPSAFLKAPIAHRAYHDRAQGRPENSRAAIRAAIEAGYGIEIDLQMSSDGQAMVFHDEELDRLTAETGPVNARSAAELGRIHLKDATDGIPTLAEVLSIVDGQVPLLVEIKDQTLTMSETDGRLEQAAAAALASYAGPVALMSFNPHSIARMSDLTPTIPRGLTTSAYDPEDWSPLDPAICDRLREIPDFGPTASSFISHEAADLARPRVLALKNHGAAILCWTIRSAAQEEAARRVAQNITFEGYASVIPS